MIGAPVVGAMVGLGDVVSMATGVAGPLVAEPAYFCFTHSTSFQMPTPTPASAQQTKNAMSSLSFSPIHSSSGDDNSPAHVSSTSVVLFESTCVSYALVFTASWGVYRDTIVSCSCFSSIAYYSAGFDRHREIQ